MKKEVRTICYDEKLRLEAYRLEGIVQPFPNHFHDYYVVGFIESGARRMSCKNQEYTLGPGDVVLFCPGENHACAQVGGEALDYRGLNIPTDTMLDLAEEVCGKRELPGFECNTVHDEELSCCLRALHEMIMQGSGEFEKEELLLLLMSTLLERYGQSMERSALEYREEVERSCAFLERNYAERVSLDQICACAGLSKSALLRAFTRSKGVTPYRYLETVRINQAKRLLEQGTAPAEAALATGFSDQSHFTNFFSMFIGMTPGAYRDIFKGREQGRGGAAHGS